MKPKANYSDLARGIFDLAEEQGLWLRSAVPSQGTGSDSALEDYENFDLGLGIEDMKDFDLG